MDTAISFGLDSSFTANMSKNSHIPMIYFSFFKNHCVDLSIVNRNKCSRRGVLLECTCKKWICFIQRKRIVQAVKTGQKLVTIGTNSTYGFCYSDVCSTWYHLLFFYRGHKPELTIVKSKTTTCKKDYRLPCVFRSHKTLHDYIHFQFFVDPI